MLTPVNVSLADYIQAVKTDRASHVRITFLGQNIVLTDEDIEASGLTVQWYLNSDTDLTMGRAMMATVQIPILNSAKVEPLLWGGEFTLEIGQEVNNTTEWTLMGYFQGNRPSKIHSVRVIDFTAHDRMSRFDVLADDWVSSLTFPMTVEDIYHSLCDYCGIEYISGDELPDIMSRSYTENPIRLTGVLCRDILAQIAEACCCYARINTDGKCQLVWYADHSSDYSLTGDDEYPPVESFDNVPPKRWSDLAHMTWNELSGFTWQDLKGTRDLFRITGMNIVDTIANAKYCYPDDTGRVVYMIVDNPFLAFDGESQSYIQDIYNRLQAFGGYLPISVDCVGNALIEVGDVITVSLDGESITMPIFCKTLTWNGGMADHYEATGNLQRQEVSPENMVKINESGRYKLVMGQVELIARDKYDKQSNILIEPEGISVTGGKYVKIESGGTFDVDSENFKIDSTNKILQAGDLEVADGSLIYHLLYPTEEQPYLGYEDFIIGKQVTTEQFPRCVGGIEANSYGLKILYTASGLKSFTFGRVVVSSNSGLSNAHLQDAIIPEPMTWLGDGNRPFGSLYCSFIQLCSTDGGGRKYGSIWGASTIKGRPYITDNNVDYTASIEMYDYINLNFGSQIYFKYFDTVYAQFNTNNASFKMPFVDFKQGISAGGNGSLGSIEVLNGSNQAVIQLSGYNGYVYCVHVQESSSREKKKDIKPITSEVDVIDKLKPVSFKYKDDKEDKTNFGLIYEDTIEVLPEICSESENGEKGIHYTGLISLLLKETQELRKRVAELEKRVNDLERR